MTERPMRNSNIKVSIRLSVILVCACSPAFAQNYSYDSLGRLTQAAASNGVTTVYHYDHAGNRTEVVTTGASVPTVADASFETPALGSGYQYTPSVGGVTFINDAGVTANNSAWNFAAAPDGNQVAFLQSGDTVQSSISQSVSGLVPGQKYAVTFYASHRPTYGVDPVTVSIGGSALMTISPPDGFTSYTTPSFTATATTTTVMFSVGEVSGDSGSGIDAVQIVPK